MKPPRPMKPPGEVSERGGEWAHGETGEAGRGKKLFYSGPELRDVKSQEEEKASNLW